MRPPPAVMGCRLGQAPAGGARKGVPLVNTPDDLSVWPLEMGANRRAEEGASALGKTVSARRNHSLAECI